MATTGQDGGGTVYIRPVVTADGVAAGVADIRREFASIPGAADQAAKATNKSLANLGAGGGKGLDEVAAATQRAVKQIERLNLELESGGRNTAAYIAGRAKLAGADVNALAPLIAQNEKLRAATALTNAEFTKAGKVFDQFGMTAKQTTAALRQVPAQFTDIVVSLQGGQAPLTVLLQQGGQLKDVFGGVGAAAKAMGGYVVGLINPFTLAAAAVGGVATAYYLGSKESDEFRKSLALSGNQVGLTVGGLADMANNMGAVSGTTGAAAGALATFAASGAVGAAGIQKATDAAMALEKYGGQAVEETAKQFKALGDDPLKASIKLNDSVNFLTTSLYEQIRALEEQGRTVEAAALAQDAFANAAKSNAGEIQANLGLIERGWIGIKSAILEAVDAAKGIGRPETIGAQIAEKQALISQYQKNGYDTTKEQAELDALNRRALREQDIATSKAQQKLETENLVAANKILDSFASKQVKMEKEILASRTALVRAGIDNKIVEETIGKIREKYKEKASKPTGISEAAREVEKGLRVYNDLIAKSTDLNADFEEKWNGLSAAYRGRKIDLDQLTAAQKELLSEQRFSKEADKAWADQSAASAKAVADLSKEYDTYVKTLDRAANAVGTQVQKLQDEETATIIAAQQNISLAQAIEQVTIARLSEAQTKAYANGDQEAGDAIKREIEARKKLATLIGGKEVREANRKAADDAAKEWQKTADKINDSITDALMRGFESGKGFAENLRDAVVNMFKTMVLRPVVQGAVDTASSGVTSVAGSIATQMGFTASAAALGPTIGAMVASAMASYAIGDAIAGGKKVGGVSGGTLGQLFGGLPGGLVAQLFGKGEELASTGDAIRRYDKGGALTENATNGAWFFTNTADANKLLDGLESRYQKAAKALGIGTVATQFDYGSNNRGNFALAGAAGNSRANTGEIAYSAEAMQVAASRAVFAALQGSELPKYLSGLLDSVGDINALSQAQIDDVLNTAQAYKGLHDVMVQMPFEALHDLSYSAAKGLVEFSGGMDKFQQSLGAYYDNFYSAEEKKAQTLANITRTLTDAGALTKTTRTAIPGEFDLTTGPTGMSVSLEQRYATSIENLDMPKTREEFRALAESLQDLGGEAAQKAYAALMSVSGAFASITPAAQDAKAALEKDLAARASWQQKLDVLTGKTTERALSLQTDLAGTTDAATQALIRQVYAQEDLAIATQAAAEATRTAIEAGQTSRAALLGSATTAAQDAFGTLSRAVEAQRAQDAAAYQAQRAIATAAFTSQAEVYQQQIDATRQSLDRVGNSVGKLQSLSGSLRSTLDGMRIAGSEGAYRADAQAQISAAVARARSGGGLPLDGQLASALATVSKPSEQLFGTFQDYARDFYKTANDIAALSSLTDAQLTADQVTQDILADQIKVLDEQKRTLKDGFAEQVSALDDILTNAQLQLDAANGLNVSVLSVADALNGFASAVSALETTRAGQGLATTVNAATTAVSGQRQTDILKYLQGVNSNSQLSDFEKAQTVYTRAQIEGVTEAEIARAWGASAEETRRWFGNAGVPQFAVGTNYVPRDMLAQIHEGEAIVPKAYNPAAGGQGGSNAELVAELRQLRAAYERQQAALDKIEKSTRSTDTTLRNVTPNGDSLQTVAA